MKIGMIGIGDIAKKAYLPILTQTKDVELHVCTRNQQTLKEVSDKYHLKNVYRSIDEWIHSGICAAFVHSSTDSHERIVNRLLDNNIHVYVDKPIAYNADTSQKRVEKARAKGLLLKVGFNRRYARPYQKLKEITDPNIVLVQKNRGHQIDEIRRFIFDDFIHVIDTLLYLLPYQVENYVIRGKQENGQLHHVVLQLEASEGTAIGIMNRDAGTTLEKVEVMGSEETRVVTNVSEISSFMDKNVFTYGNNDWQPTLEKRGFYHIIAAFLESVRNNAINKEENDEDLKRHLIAEKVVQELEKKV